MNRQKSLTRIAELLGRFTNEVTILNKAGLYDINIHAETVLIPLLKLTHGLELANANFTEKGNFSAVDLIDNRNRVTFQITSTSDNEKIKHTLNQFIKHERYNDYDILFIYIIGNKQASYSGKGHAEILQDKLVFDKNEHIIDNNDLFKKINGIISLDQITAIEQLLEKEFTDQKIEQRKRKLEDPQSALHSYPVYCNLLPTNCAKDLFIADLNIDREAIIKSSWETTYKLKMDAGPRKVLRRAIDNAGYDFFWDWHTVNNKIITFRNLNDPAEPLTKFIDAGTITPIKADEYWSIDEDHKRDFAALLNFSLQQKLKPKAINYISDDGVYRFTPDGPIVKQRTVEWKLKKRSKRTVIFELLNKEKQQIVCFRHLAFDGNFHLFDDKWHLSINPTWSFTSDGYKKSGLSKYYMPGLKRLENNNTIYYAFRFISYCLTNQIKDEDPYRFIEFDQPVFDNLMTDMPENESAEPEITDDIPLE